MLSGVPGSLVHKASDAQGQTPDPSLRSPVEGQGAKPSSPTRANEVYMALRDQIVHGLLRPNERITETDLASQLNVSRTPIREALQMLARDGLIVSRRRGWVVYEFTFTEIRHLSEIRAALEGFAAGRAALVTTPEQVDELEVDYAEWRSKVAGDRRHIVAVNDQFHLRVNELSQNPFLVSMIRDSQRYYFNHQAASLYTDEELWRSMSDHDAIIAALRSRDANAAERIAREHVEEFIELLKSRTYNPYEA